MGDHISLDDRHFLSVSRGPEDEVAPAPKRRKLRKGTQSCWECKRRKAKCIFSDHLGVCESCKKRGTDCVSQDVEENPPPQGSNKHLVDRLGEVEALVQHLLKASQNERRSQESSVSPEDRGSRRQSRDDEQIRSSSLASLFPQPDIRSEGLTTDLITDLTPRSEEYISSITVDEPISPGPHDALYTELVAAWPIPGDMKIILSLPTDPSQILRALTCASSKQRSSDIKSPTHLLRLPPRGSHPVLVARKMLVLATYLQGVPIASEKHLDKLSTSYEKITDRIVKVVHEKVTCNDDLVSSLEGIECIILEGIYQNYGGSLRKSWLAARRAVMIAQMMGLNRGIAPSSFRGVTIDVDDLWFRLITFDRYLCLMLGLPQSSPDEPIPQVEGLESYPSNRRLQTLCTVACGKLLNRKPSQMYDQAITKEIDEILRDACTSMPAQWWIMPTLTSNSDVRDRVRETLQLNDHFLQYHLLLQLHMPYLLRADGGESCIYNKLTAITASREILMRFIAARTAPHSKSYCRGTDLIAFMASTALTLGHILCDHRRKRIEDHGFHFLTQQRLSDRGLLERVLSIAEKKVQTSDDELSKRLLTLLHYLLSMEDNVTAGFSYSVSFAEGAIKDGNLGHRVNANDDGTVLEIHLPHYPVIRMLRRDPEGKEALSGITAVPWGNVPSAEETSGRLVIGASRQNGTGEALSGIAVVSSGPSAVVDTDVSPMLTANTWTLEGFDMSFLDSFIEGPIVV